MQHTETPLSHTTEPLQGLLDAAQDVAALSVAHSQAWAQLAKFDSVALLSFTECASQVRRSAYLGFDQLHDYLELAEAKLPESETRNSVCMGIRCWLIEAHDAATDFLERLSPVQI